MPPSVSRVAGKPSRMSPWPPSVAWIRTNRKPGSSACRATMPDMPYASSSGCATTTARLSPSAVGRSTMATVCRSSHWLRDRDAPYAGRCGRSPPTTAAREEHVTGATASLRRTLEGLPGVDAVGLEARAASLGTRSIKTTSKQWAIDLAISMVDLTTLEGSDTPGKVRALSAKALKPDPTDPSCPSAAAVCVYPDMVRTVREVVGDQLHVAAVATAFPSGRAALDIKLADTQDAVEAGADEIDMVIDRGAFLSGRYLQVFEEIVAVREVCERPDGSSAHLNVIFETGELQPFDNIRGVSWPAMMAGAQFIKTSTGKVPPAATMPGTLILLEAVRDFREATGQMVGVKPAGGIRSSKEAIKYLVMVNEVAGADWLDPDWFRFGASTLLNDLLMQRTKMRTGRYSGPDYFTLD